MKGKLGIHHKQGLKLYPKLLQSIKVMSLSNSDLLEYIEKEVSENPLIESEMPPATLR